MNGGQMRITDEEFATIKSLYADNEAAIKMLRKIFLPEVEPNAPLGQNIDLWMTLDLGDQSPEQAIINLKARNLLIQHVEQRLMQLKTLAGTKTETVEETKKKLIKDSSK
jgi:hypothetical protein